MYVNGKVTMRCCHFCDHMEQYLQFLLHMNFNEIGARLGALSRFNFKETRLLSTISTVMRTLILGLSAFAARTAGSCYIREVIRDV